MHEKFMKLAIKEAEKGLGSVSPNPVVGAVLVDPKNGQIIAKGHHRCYGCPHAEVEAIKKAGEKTRGAILYVTLEPCNHYGKTPPCTQAILKAGIKEVICGIRDPNPVARGGLEFLKDSGVKVFSGVLENEVKYLTRFFLSRVLRGRPWVIMKVASSLDGKISVSTGDSKWITGEKSRKKGHYLRKMCDAILVGKNTVLLDDPELTCRMVKGKNPVRIVLDTRLSLPPNLKIFDTKVAPTVVVCADTASKEKEEEFKKRGVKIWRVGLKKDKIDLKEVLNRALEAGINSILVEGGGKVHGSFVEERLIDEIYYFFGPLIIGDELGASAVKSSPLKRLKDALKVKILEVKRLGEDVLIKGLTDTGLKLLNTPLG